MLLWKPFLQYSSFSPKIFKWFMKQLRNSAKPILGNTVILKPLKNGLKSCNEYSAWSFAERFGNVSTKKTLGTSKSILDLIQKKNFILDYDQQSLVDEFQKLQKAVIECNESGVVQDRLQKTVKQIIKTSKNRHFGKKDSSKIHATKRDGFSKKIFNSIKSSIVCSSNFLRSSGIHGEQERMLGLEEGNPGKTNSLTKKHYQNDYRCLYVWGGVGRGKTMLMDMFFESLPIDQKRRFHFHTFMLHLNDLLYEIQNENLKDSCPYENEVFKNTKKTLSTIDPLLSVTYDIAFRTKVICLDEFQVIHIADAMILKRVLESLWNFGCLIVVTSNRPPQDLYQGGLNRDLFLPFIDFVKSNWNVHNIGSSKDYRVEKSLKLRNNSEEILVKGYWNPGRSLDKIVENMAFLEGEKTCNVKSLTISVNGNRQFQVPHAVGKACALSFDKLCRDAVGVPDYLALSQHFSTVFLYSIPVLDKFYDQQNEIRRFIKLIDIFYERKKKLIFDCEAPLLKLFGATEITTAFDDLFQALKKTYPEGIAQFYDHVEKLRTASHGASRENLLKVVLGRDLELPWNSTFTYDVKLWDNCFRCSQYCQVYDTSDGIISSGPSDAFTTALMYYATFGSLKNELLQYLDLGENVEINKQYFQPIYKFNFCKRGIHGGTSSSHYDDNEFAATRCLSRIVDMLSEGYGV